MPVTTRLAASVPAEPPIEPLQAPATPPKRAGRKPKDPGAKRDAIPAVQTSSEDNVASPVIFKSEAQLQDALAHVTQADAVLATLAAGRPTPVKLLEQRDKTCFEALAQSIVYQQLHGKAAAAIHERLLTLCKAPLTPASLLGARREDLRACGLSERKAEYLVGLANHFSGAALSDDHIRAMPDARIADWLMQIKGVGPWTVDMLCIFQLGRADVLPVGDLGVRKGMAAAYGMKALPTPEQMRATAAAWAPYRTLGAYLMWQVTDTLTASPTSKRRKGGGGRAGDDGAAQET